jgi:hypothetical protein
MPTSQAAQAAPKTFTSRPSKPQTPTEQFAPTLTARLRPRRPHLSPRPRGREGGGARDEGVRSGRLRRRLLPRRPLINPNAKRSPLPAGVPAAPRAEAARRPVGGGAGAWVRVRPQDARARRVGAGTRARRAGRRAPRQPLQAPHAGSKHPAAPSASGLPARGRCQRTGAAAARPRPCPRCGLLLELPMTRYEVIRLDLEKRTGKPAVPRGPSPSGKQGSCVAG